MSEHYYIEHTNTKSNPQSFSVFFNDKEFIFTTDNGVFSKKYLDFGSYVMLKAFQSSKKNILDLGCGYGPIGIILAGLDLKRNVLLADINERAVSLAEENIKLNNLSNVSVIKSDILSNIKQRFDCIVTNPPIRAGKKTIFKFYEEAYANLHTSGELFVVIQKKQGALSTIAKLNELFGNTEIIKKEKGYFIIKSVKNS